MSYKDELLKFLYKSSSNRTEIHPVTDDCGYLNKDIKESISDLKKDKIIDTDNNYRQIGCGDPKKLMTSKSLKITVRLTPFGEKYVRETYFKEENEKTFSANQIVYVNGDNSGQIAQTDNQAESHFETKTEITSPAEDDNFIAVLFSKKRIVEIIIGVLILIIGYFVMKWLHLT